MLINTIPLSPFTPFVDILSVAFYLIFVSFMGEKKKKNVLLCSYHVKTVLFWSMF